MTVKLLQPFPPYVAGELFSSDSNTEAGLVGLGVATPDTSGGTTPNLQPPKPSPTTAGWLVLTSDYVVRTYDDGACFACSVPLTITFPDGLLPRPNIIVMSPPSGVVTLVGRLNGASPATMTRSRANNRAGFAVTPDLASDFYGVGGV